MEKLKNDLSKRIFEYCNEMNFDIPIIDKNNYIDFDNDFLINEEILDKLYLKFTDYKLLKEEIIKYKNE
jgi:hypothetical protein